MASRVPCGMRVTRETSARLMRFVSRSRRRVVPTVSVLTSSSSWWRSRVGRAHVGGGGGGRARIGRRGTGGAERLDAELSGRGVGRDVPAFLAVFGPLGVAGALA